MQTIDDLLHVCRAEITSYAQEYPRELFKLHHLLRQVAEQGIAVFDRKNMDGHVTVSVLVINEDMDAALLIHHKAYNTWIPPGGHIESGSFSLLENGLRELSEETGLTLVRNSATLLDIDTHPIPARPEKGEDAHWHHDFMFVVKAPGSFEPTFQESELHGAAWRPMKDMLSDFVPRNRRLAEKVKDLVNGCEGLD